MFPDVEASDAFFPGGEWSNLLDPLSPPVSLSGTSASFDPSSVPLQPHKLIEYYQQQHPLLDDVAIQGLAKQAWHESFLEATNLGWAGKEDEVEEPNGQDWWAKRQAYYVRLGFPRSLDLWDERRMRKKDFLSCMDLLTSLTAEVNVERVTGLLRGVRLGYWCGQQPSASNKTENAWQSSLLNGLRLVDEIEFVEARQHLLIARAVEMLTIGQDGTRALGGAKIKEALLPLAGQRFHGWDDSKWDHLARNMVRFQALRQALGRKVGTEVALGLALMLSTKEWNWTAKGKVTRIKKEAWSWFAGQVPLLSPNLVRMIAVLDRMGRAILDGETMPALLRMEVERPKAVNFMVADELGSAVGEVPGWSETDVVSWYEMQTVKPWSWKKAVEELVAPE